MLGCSNKKTGLLYSGSVNFSVSVFGPYYSCYTEVVVVYICIYRCSRLCIVCVYSFDYYIYVFYGCWDWV